MPVNPFKRLGQAVNDYPRKSVLVFLVIFCLFYGLKMDSGGIGGGDDVHYMRGAYYLATKGTYSDSPDRNKITPSVRRAPGYALFLAGCIKTIPPLRNDSFDWLFPETGKKVVTPKTVIYIKYAQALLLLLTAAMAAFLVFDMTGSPGLTYFTLFAVAFHPFLERYANRLYTECLGAFLITTFSVSLYLALKRRGLLFFILSGLALGFLTLTYAQWKYVTCVTIAAALIHILLDRRALLRSLTGVVLMAGLWVAIFYPWQLRNLREFGQPIISAGGGSVLETRALYNLVPRSAYWSSFLYWSRAPLLKKILEDQVPVDKYRDLLRDDPNGVYQKAQAKKKRLIAKEGLVKADRIMKRDGIALILAHPLEHLQMSVPVAFRLMMNPMLSVLYIGVYLLFLLAVLKALKRRQWTIAATLASPLTLFCFNSLATHGLPRYNEVAAPLLVVGAVVGWYLSRNRDFLGEEQTNPA